MGREIVSIATALVPYPPERVWAVVTDLDCWQWRSDLSRLDHVGEDAFTEYDRSGFPTRFTVTERRPCPAGPLTWTMPIWRAGGPGNSGRRAAAPRSPSPRPSP